MMASVKVQALYDFTGEPGSAELSITAGEILTVTRQDVGEGWWEGTNQQGQTGLFPAAYVENFEVGDYWDEEWDDDSEGQPQLLYSDVPTNQYSSVQHVENSSKNNENKTLIGRKNFNKYSAFAKTGGESFIMYTSPKVIPDNEKVVIIEIDDNIYWSPNQQPYVCTVASPKKESKLKGLKSFIAYQLTPSFNNLQVSRRYKHFDWLHERLVEKFSLIPIPPLPDKQISGRYEEQFIEHRKNQLQAFVDCVCKHPVLSRSAVWEHFISCTDEKLWKSGKRKAEKDELVGDNYFYALETPEKSLNHFTIEQEITSCSRFVQNMDGAVKHLMATSLDQSKKHQGPYKREFQKVGHAFYALGQAMSIEQPKYTGHEHLVNAIKASGDAYNEIGMMFEEQPKLDWEPLGDMLHVYKGILASLPEILAFYKRASQTKKECDKLTIDQKMTPSQLDGVSKRVDVVSYAILAEINHFQNERAEEVSKSLKNFLMQQINFYQMITSKLQQALSTFDG